MRNVMQLTLTPIQDTKHPENNVSLPALGDGSRAVLATTPVPVTSKRKGWPSYVSREGSHSSWSLREPLTHLPPQPPVAMFTREGSMHSVLKNQWPVANPRKTPQAGWAPTVAFLFGLLGFAFKHSKKAAMRQKPLSSFFEKTAWKRAIKAARSGPEVPIQPTKKPT